MTPAPATPMRRVLAFAVDYAVVAAYATALAAIHARLGSGDFTPPQDLAGKLAGHGLSFAAFTAPAILYFAIAEASAGRTLGKAALGAVVVGLDGGRLGLGRALLRNLVKFAPWELAHVGVWYVPGRPFLDPPGGLSMVVFVVSLALAAAWLAGLFTPSGRTVYDRAAGSVVRRRRGAR